jgi:hypothetical protein
VVTLAYLEWQADARAVAAGLALTLVLAHLSYHLVENPARLQLVKRRWAWSATVLTCSTVVLAVAGFGVRWNDGVTGRFSSAVERIADESENSNPRAHECLTSSRKQPQSCVYGGAHLRAILIGDSHGNAVVTAMAKALPLLQDGLLEWTHVACPTALGVEQVFSEHAGQGCREFLEWTLKNLAAVATDVPVVIVNRTAGYAFGDDDGRAETGVPSVHFGHAYKFASPVFLTEFAERLTATACQLAKDRPVYMVRPIPEMLVGVPKTVATAKAFGVQRDVSISLDHYRQRNAFAWAAQDAARDRCGIKILDPLPYLCWDGRCHGTKDGWPLYHDDDHLSEYGNKLLVPMFAQIFSKG